MRDARGSTKLSPTEYPAKFMNTPIQNLAACLLSLLIGASSSSFARQRDIEQMPATHGPFVLQADGNDRDQNVPLHDAVSMVQQRFNATAVKTDTVVESGQTIYRIRLLSADKSRVWTVTVDARTGRVY